MSGEIVSFGEYASLRQSPVSATAPEGARLSESGFRARAQSSPPAAVHLEEVADAARGAGLSFLAGVRSGFDKRALAGWLVGPYRRATSFANAHARKGRESDRPAISVEIIPPSAHGSVVRADTLDALLHRARVQVLAALEGASHSRVRPSFVQEAIARGHVASIDVGGVIGFFPRDLPGMRLRDRVLSLFAADCLARPADYAAELLVCPWCESVRFDEAARHRGMCADHGRPSGIVSKLDHAEVLGHDQTHGDDRYEADETDVALRLPMRALIAG